jgi:hypothetical protein
MLEKFIQAAIITFLIHLLAAISSNTSIPSKPTPSLSETPNAMPLATIEDANDLRSTSFATATSYTNITLLPLNSNSDGL